jgi:hypothetical protein
MLGVDYVLSIASEFVNGLHAIVRVTSSFATM